MLNDREDEEFFTEDSGLEEVGRIVIVILIVFAAITLYAVFKHH